MDSIRNLDELGELMAGANQLLDFVEKAKPRLEALGFTPQAAAMRAFKLIGIDLAHGEFPDPDTGPDGNHKVERIRPAAA